MGTLSINIPKRVKVTYLLGNGFDIGLGLKTRYNDFLKTFVVSKSDDSPVVARFRQFIKEDLSKDSMSWSDAEKRFGALPFSNFAKESNIPLSEVLIKLDSCFQSELADYLRSEEFKFIIPDGRRENCRKKMMGYFLHLLNHTIGVGGGIDDGTDVVEFNFITLNYTRSLNQFLGMKQGEEWSIKLRDDDEMSRMFIRGPKRIIIGRVCHAHGSLFKYEHRLFGVNDSWQISDEDARQICMDEGYLIKTEEDKHVQVGHRKEAVELMESTDILVLFGTSYGQTDKIWWQTIVNKVENDKFFRVVLVPYVPNSTKSLSAVEDIYRASSERKKFFCGISEEASDAMARQYEKQFFVVNHGPYDERDKPDVFCDPLYLRDFRREYLRKESQSNDLILQIEEVKTEQLQQFRVETVGLIGSARFDFTRNNGRFTIDIMGEQFTTKWSTCGEDSVYVYSTNAVSIGIQDEGAIWPIEKFFAKDFDWSNYSKKIRVNGVCIITNDNKKLLAVRIISVKSIDYGADCNELVIDYKMIGE